jgi:hypothetical protein
MAAHNPYAPLPAALGSGAVHGPTDGARRDGKWIVLPPGGDLPHRCVKCNGEPDEPTRVRKVLWHHPGVYLLVLFNIIIYAIVAAIVSKKIRVTVALCSAHKRRRRTAILIAWAGVIASVVLPLLFGSQEFAGEWLGFCILLFLGSCLFGILRARLLYAKKIDEYGARLGGAGPAYLDSLP